MTCAVVGLAENLDIKYCQLQQPSIGYLQFIITTAGIHSMWFSVVQDFEQMPIAGKRHEALR